MIPEQRRGRWVSEDFIDSDSDDEYREHLRTVWRRKTQQAKADSKEYTKFKGKGLTDLQAYVAAYAKMPATKKKPQGIGKTAKAKKAASTAAAKKKGYGGSTVDWDMVKKLADSAVKKEVNKNIETQYSQAMVCMTHTPDHVAQTGWDLGGLNFDQAAKVFDPDQAMIFNLGYLSQQGSSLTPGYRVGQRINAKYIKVTIAANLPQLSADCTYHWRIVRRKNDQTGQQSYSAPALTSITTIGLYKPLTDGPFASLSQYGLGGSSANPFPFFSSANRQNTDAWTFCKGGHGYKYVKGQPIDVDTNDDKYVASFCESLYFPLEEEWDFVSRTGSDIKGGNYFFVLWREGGTDYVQYTASPTVTSALGLVQIKVLFELAYKDG